MNIELILNEKNVPSIWNTRQAPMATITVIPSMSSVVIRFIIETWGLVKHDVMLRIVSEE
jgi:hypothetical protein